MFESEPKISRPPRANLDGPPEKVPGLHANRAPNHKDRFYRTYKHHLSKVIELMLFSAAQYERLDRRLRIRSRLSRFIKLLFLALLYELVKGRFPSIHWPF